MVQDAAGLQAASKGKYQYNLTDTFLLRGTTERMERYNRCEHSQVCYQAAHVYYLMQDAKLLGMLSPSSDHHEYLHLSKECSKTAQLLLICNVPCYDSRRSLPSADSAMYATPT